MMLQSPNQPKIQQFGKIIKATAMGSEKDVVRGYDMGATTYIVKPFSPVELLARVKSLIKA